jgi:hypothetical protein
MKSCRRHYMVRSKIMRFMPELTFDDNSLLWKLTGVPWEHESLTKVALLMIWSSSSRPQYLEVPIPVKISTLKTNLLAHESFGNVVNHFSSRWTIINYSYGNTIKCFFSLIGIPFQNPRWYLFVQIDKLILWFIWKCNTSTTFKIIL